MEVPRVGVESELQLPTYTTATTTWDPSRVCNLHHSSWQRQNLNPLGEARDRTLILIGTSQIPFRCASMGIPSAYFIFTENTGEFRARRKVRCCLLRGNILKHAFQREANVRRLSLKKGEVQRSSCVAVKRGFSRKPGCCPSLEDAGSFLTAAPGTCVLRLERPLLLKRWWCNVAAAEVSQEMLGNRRGQKPAGPSGL